MAWYKDNFTFYAYISSRHLCHHVIGFCEKDLHLGVRRCLSRNDTNVRESNLISVFTKADPEKVHHSFF
jgi:hypothetical protein